MTKQFLLDNRNRPRHSSFAPRPRRGKFVDAKGSIYVSSAVCRFAGIFDHWRRRIVAQPRCIARKRRPGAGHLCAQAGPAPADSAPAGWRKPEGSGALGVLGRHFGVAGDHVLSWLCGRQGFMPTRRWPGRDCGAFVLCLQRGLCGPAHCIQPVSRQCLGHADRWPVHAHAQRGDDHRAVAARRAGRITGMERRQPLKICGQAAAGVYSWQPHFALHACGHRALRFWPWLVGAH